MYGSEESDLVVKYYDLAFGISGTAEVEWYLGRVRADSGPVLDLACGTGRLALPIAEEGLEVVAVDLDLPNPSCDYVPGRDFLSIVIGRL